MANNNDNKVLNVPNLRFPEFCKEWYKVTLRQIASKINTKNKDNVISTVFSNSATQGIVLQSAYFDKEIANKDNLNGYFVVEPNDFVYNPRLSANAKVGAMSVNHTNKIGLVSPLYTIFRVNSSEIHIDFLESIFKSNVWHSYMRSIANFGARDDRMNIKNDDLFALPLSITSIEEQRKIAKLLNITEERIATQNKIIDRLQSLIKGLNDYIQNSIYGEVVCFSELGEPYSGLSGKIGDDFGTGKPFITYMNVYQNTYVSDKEVGLVKISANEKQNHVRYGDALFTLSSETPEEVGMGAVYLGNEEELYLNSFCFGVHINDSYHVHPQYLAYLISSTNFRKSVYPLAQGSTRFNLQKNDFMRMRFTIPELSIQKRIAETLDNISNRLAIEQQLQHLYIQQKQHLLCQMFI